MNNKIKKIALLVGIILIIIVGIYCLAQYSVNIESKISGISARTLANEGIGTLVMGENPANYNYNIGNMNTGWTADGWREPPYFVPTCSGYQTYCIEPNGCIRNSDGVFPSYTPIGQYNLPIAAAYIVSDQPYGWSPDKQKAIWNLKNVTFKNHSTGATINADANDDNDNFGRMIKGENNAEIMEKLGSLKTDYDTVAKYYAEYDTLVRNKGLNPENKTNIENICTEVDQENKEYTIGPFNITYTEGICSYTDINDNIDKNIAFSGISEIKAVGYNSKKQVVNQNIRIKNIILKDKTGKYESAVNPEYFEPSSDLKVDTTTQIYPASGQEFKIVIDAPNSSAKIAYISIEVKFKYMLANGKYTKFTGTKVWYGSELTQQTLMAADAIRSIYEQKIEMTTPIKTTIDLGGYVWEDVVATKESKADGVKGNNDKPLKNVKVTVYTSNGEAAVLLSDPSEAGIKEAQIMNRVNPTYTDENGRYLFEGLDPMKRYYVQFEYNGQTYLPTEYLKTKDKQYTSALQMVNAGLYNTNDWKITSKGTEIVNDRTKFDQRFAEIGSYPENYTSSNSTKNVTFSQRDLMGYTLDDNGKYRKTKTQLIDGYLYDENGLETKTFAEGVISQKVREYIKNNKKFPNARAMQSIYKVIERTDTEAKKKLQFIEDCKIQSYTQPQGKSHDLYPVQTKFVINKKNQDGLLFINQGLWKRQEFDVAIRKDVYSAVMKINNKTIMYKYDKRSDDEKYWDINVRMSDYDAYYGTGYNREVYKTDYVYDPEALHHPGAKLNIYVTYKITVRNQSQSIMAQIKEVVDYYDKDYTYRDNLSWITYAGGDKTNTVSDDDYYKAMIAENISGNIKNARATKASSGQSRYGTTTHSDMTKECGVIYVKGLEDKKLATGESAYIYLTFQVNKQNEKVILDNENSLKMNYAEINGYATYYRDNTSLPNGIKKTSNNIAGLIDKDSNPGNLTKADINGNKYEKNFEDDTDRAKGLRVFVDETVTRKANGTVWEDARTLKSGDSFIGDGIRQNEETKIAGVTVQLVEKTIDGKEYIWQETTTNNNGQYSFEGYIPGDYVIRFYYGNNVSTTKVKGNNDYSNGGQNDTSYNGQDFKSTIYQKDITQSTYTDEANRYTGYKNTNTQNETGTYGYNIYESDRKANVSDAKDLWSVSTKFERAYKPNVTINEKKEIQGRNTVINYSNGEITNHKAEILASPYNTPTYNDTKYTSGEMDALINELINNTYMTAETGVIAVEFEYNRQKSEGTRDSNGANEYLNGNDKNGTYVLNNVDLGLTERPKAQLEIDKSISNLKVTLANGSVLFDVNKAGDNVIWKDHIPYNLVSKKDSRGIYNDYGRRISYREEVNQFVKKSDKGLIQLTMDEELMHGATIEITYKVKVTNVGETDYVGQKYYYLGDSSGASKVTTVANQVVDYVANNLKFNNSNTANGKWELVKVETLIPSKDADTEKNLVNRRLMDNAKQYNNIIQPKGLNKVLTPGQSTEEVTLVLTQLISTENTSDDLTYSNMVEIVKTTNTAGRRMAYSVVGNQDPTVENASEVDSSVAEKVIILPPFGETRIFYILGAVIGLILIGGITFIIKKVLKK